jgi:hypothetical protein
MNKTTVVWLAVAFVASFLAVGIPYWQIAYANVSLPDTLYSPALLVVCVASAASRVLGKAKLPAAIFIVGAAVPAVVLARISVDTFADPTSHNLWPFEVVIAKFIGLVCSSVGALAGGVSRLFSRNK